ncbi:MAG: 2-dehydro-3-deoxyphosphogluconate aldolase, partial [Rhodospirillaceae bacterium]|nr:2-dehydro-3-deoxyphosphogluconate aldolase [Rhodospirillaceae bacterium]
MRDLFERFKVIPVLIFAELKDAAPTAAALISGGLPVLEVT